MADHGEALGEHGESTHVALVYQSTVRAPWLLRLPEGRLGGHVVHEPVRALDVAPTLLGLLEAPALENADGVDLSPFLPGGRVPELAVYSESLYLNLLLGWAELRSLRRGSLEVIDGARREAFGLASDPEETANLFIKERLRPGAESLLVELRKVAAEESPGLRARSREDRGASGGIGIPLGVDPSPRRNPVASSRPIPRSPSLSGSVRTIPRRFSSRLASRSEVRKENAHRLYFRFLAVTPETLSAPREIARSRLAGLEERD